MKITIKNIWNVSEYNPNSKSILISIVDNKDFNTDFYNKYIRVLKMDIDDIDLCVYPEIANEKYNIFNINYYNQVIDFIKNAKEEGIEEIVLHCSAGVSRSPALAMGICKYLELEEEYKAIINSKGYFPNLYILSFFTSVEEETKKRLEMRKTKAENKVYTIEELLKED